MLQQLTPELLERLRAMAEQQRANKWMLVTPSLVLKLVAAIEAHRHPDDVPQVRGPGW
jgi:hypothetical protein